MGTRTFVSPNDAIRRPRVLVVYQYIALYRLPLFRALARSNAFSFLFQSGTTSRGHAPRFATEQELARAEFDWVPARNRWLPGGFLWQSGVLDAVAQPDIDAVIFLGDVHYISSWVGLILCRVLKKPAYLWTIGLHRPESGFKLAVRLVFLRLARHVFVYGDYARNLLLEAGVPDSRMTTIANSLDFEAQQEHYVRALESGFSGSRADEGSFRLLALGRLTARRRLDVLIRAVALLSASRDVRASLVGSGPERERLHAIAEELGVLDRIDFCGAIYEEAEIARLACQSDLCVVPGVIGLGAVHAHGYGLPVVTCGNWEIQAPEAEVIVPGKTGSYCPWGDAEALADVISSWIDADFDRDHVREACVAEVEKKWTPTRQVEIFERILSGS